MGTTTSRPRRAIDANELTFLFTVKTPHPEDEERLWEFAMAARPGLTDRIAAILSEIFPSEFRLRSVEVTRGSVTIWVYIAGGYVVISRYQNFVRSLELFASHVRDLLRQVFENFSDISVSGGEQLPTSKSSRWRQWLDSPLDSESLHHFIFFLLVFYLILSHAALLVVVLRLLLHH